MSIEDEKVVWDVLKAPDGLSAIDEDDREHLIPVDEFIDDVSRGNFVDYDGYGYWAISTGYLNDWNKRVWPSEIKSGLEVPYWASHILWFNR